LLLTKVVGAITGASVGSGTHVVMGASKDIAGVGERGAQVVAATGKGGGGGGDSYVLTKAAWPVHIVVKSASLTKYVDEMSEGDMQL